MSSFLHISHMCCPGAVQRKVRDVKYCREIGRLGTLSADGTMMLWDAQLGHVRTVRCWLATWDPATPSWSLGIQPPVHTGTGAF